MHESSMYFERCHAAELRDDIAASVRAECWRRWLEWYAYGQEPARVLHARERIVFLSQDMALDPLPTPAIAESPAPETPPVVPAQEGQGTVPQPHVYVPGVPSPRDYRESPACETVCRPRWEACASPCTEEEAGRRACLGACQADYTSCMRACY